MKRIIFTITLLSFTFCFFAQQINKAEYFFDSDPGVGNGTSISVTTNDSVSLNSTVPINSLSAGFHKLGLRFRYTNGVWSLNEARTFYVSSSIPAVATMISKAEYFVDIDPGKGNGTILSLTSGDSVTLASAISLGALTPGFHRLVTRFSDNNNVWSLNEARGFYVASLPVTTANKIIKAEYFFDTDPGQGNATTAAITAGDSVSIITSIPISALSQGFHRMFYRFYDDKGKWSMNEARSFFINTPVVYANAQVVAAEYFFNGIDPGVGNATAIIGFTPGDSATIKKIIVASGLAAGQKHKLTIRTKDSKKVWSLNETRTFDVCNAPAVAGFTTSVSGNTVTVTNSSTNAYGYLWRFGDDSTSTIKNTTHTYAFGGIFNICLIAYNPCGNDTMYKTINFSCTPPSAYFTPSISQLSVGVNNYSSGATIYSWNFGDGYTSTSASPKHIYYATGTYTVCVTASNGCGSNSYCTPVSVICAIPYAQFTSSVNGLTGYFNNQSTNAANVNWYFGDGGISNQLSPTHTYNGSGTYTAKLVVSNACGIDSITRTVQIACALPIPSYNINADGLTVQFENNSTGSTSYKWDFGDGTTSLFKSPTHKFPATNVYNVCMVATNSCGKDSICTQVSVCIAPTADFISSDSLLTATFFNSSLNGDRFYWTFGNGYASNQVNPSVKYVTPGTYNVCLNVTNSCGANKICKNVTTSCSPFGPPQICLVTVDSLSNNNVIYWDKTPFAGGIVDSFIVYREIATDLYRQIAIVPYSALSVFEDTVRAKYKIPYANGDPNKGTYRYKIQYKDTCGGYSPLSRYHNSIYIVYNLNGQFSWNPGYSIESAANPVSNYLLLRDDNSTGSWKTIASVSGTQNTLVDNNFATYPSGSWRVKTQWNIVCNATLAFANESNDIKTLTETTVNNSRSNIKNNLPVIGINEHEVNSLVHVYPNPANTTLNIEWPELLAVDQPQVAIRNYLGMEVLKYTPEKSQLKISVNISGLAAGLYFIELRTNNYHIVKKVVVN